MKLNVVCCVYSSGTHSASLKHSMTDCDIVLIVEIWKLF